jgi:hypothetical protein
MQEIGTYLTVVGLNADRKGLFRLIVIDDLQIGFLLLRDIQGSASVNSALGAQ